MLRLLLVEDDPADVVLVRQALALARVRCELLVETSAEGAMAEIGRQRAMSVKALDAMLLDLGLPDRDGLSVLADLKSLGWNQDLYSIALTGNHDPAVVEAVYRHGANSFMNKPINVNEFVDLLRGEGYWLSLSR